MNLEIRGSLRVEGVADGFLRQRDGQRLVVGLPLPVGGDLADQHLSVFRADVEGGLDPLGKLRDGQVEEVAVELRVDDAVAALLP